MVVHFFLAIAKPATEKEQNLLRVAGTHTVSVADGGRSSSRLRCADVPNIDGKDVSPDEAMLLGRCSRMWQASHSKDCSRAYIGSLVR